MLSDMKKLKTLKDLWWETETDNRYYTGLDVHLLRRKDFDKIRMTAREWINANQEKIDSFEVFLYDEVVMKREYEAINKWIKYFFNLDEEV